MDKRIIIVVLALFYTGVGYATSTDLNNNTLTTMYASNNINEKAVHKIFKVAKNECIELANQTTQKIFKHFDPEQFATNTNTKSIMP